MNRLTAFYDARCAMCIACRRWIEKEPKYLAVDFVSYQSKRAREICPDLDRFDPAGEIVVMADDGGIYRGGKAWIMCLYALKGYREWALRLAQPSLLPVAKKLCHLISTNRLTLSKFLRNRGLEDLKRELAATPPPIPTGANCENGTCRIN